MVMSSKVWIWYVLYIRPAADMKSTYRIRGIAVPDRDMVVFDLTTAYRVQEGHLVG